MSHTAAEAEEKGNVDINNFIDMEKIDLEAFKQLIITTKKTFQIFLGAILPF